MELHGIENEAEFFPAGTLSDVLKVEIQDLTSNWVNLENGNHPEKRLSEIAEFYLNSLHQIRNTKNKERQSELYTEMHHKLLEALGYTYRNQTELTALEGSNRIPLIGRVSDDRQDMMWLLQTPLSDISDESSDPLSDCFIESQFPESEREVAELKLTIEEIIPDGIFALQKPPKFILVVGLSQIVLIDERKWASRSVLRFDLQEIFSRRDQDTLNVTACLISREARVPEQGIPISERIEEEAQRNANAVTSSLKRTVRDAIEILGQEVLDVTEGKYPTGDRKGIWIDGPDLSQECLRYMYRLLFLFYVEANPRLNILDKDNPAYMKGYSIEMLRELESIRLRTQEEREGTFLWESLQKTLTLFFEGEDSFLKLPAIKVSLLAPESTPLLNSVRLRNEAVQKIIRLLSLKSTKKSTSRISYAKLGIGQLGAVYETLISFTGVVAKTDLIQIVPSQGKRLAGDTDDEDSDDDVDLDTTLDNDAMNLEDEFSGLGNQMPIGKSIRNDTVDTLAPSYFVPRNRIDDFKSSDIVFQNNKALVYPKGTFIYRLAGRDREKSASYYTPEPLAKLLVKHALEELCAGLNADEILELKILEPAMGSAAFLVEATNQLADIYLERKQKETNKTIKQEEITTEKQKVRAFIADRNCFGVDLNPIAAELGAISLWLNGLHAGDFSPWFGDQLHAGNSLLGARRAAYSPETLSSDKKNDLWLNQVPKEIGWKENLPDGYIWQWLLPASEMVNFENDKTIKKFAGETSVELKKWKKSNIFNKFEHHEIELLQRLSKVADDLFHQVAQQLEKTRTLTNDEITLWPNKYMRGNCKLDFRKKTRLNELVLDGVNHATNSLPYKQLKTAMDAWCALWVWPLDKVDDLPTRTEFFHGMTKILDGSYMSDGSISAFSMEEFSEPEKLLDLLDMNSSESNSKKEKNTSNVDFFGDPILNSLADTFKWLGIAIEVSKREKFVHFDLIFADVLKSRGGFDLILGNPPWAQPNWKESQFLEDINPKYIGCSATKAVATLPIELTNIEWKNRLLTEIASVRGSIKMSSSKVTYPYLEGGSNNLYRSFIDLSFRMTSSKGCAALIHQDGHLSDPNSGKFRSHWFQRIHKHFHFINAFKKKNFSEIGSAKEFSLNIYRGTAGDIDFENFSQALLPSQIEESYRHDGSGRIPAIKDIFGDKWNTTGHKKRIVKIKRNEFDVLASLSSLKSDTRMEARFYQPINSEFLKIFEKYAKFSKLGESDIDWQNSRMWDETEAQKKKIIVKQTGFGESNKEVILNGSMVSVGNPLYKIAREKCLTKSDFDCTSLTEIPDDYIPRTNFSPLMQGEEFRHQMPKCDWNPNINYADQIRFAIRRGTATITERTMIGGIIPEEVSHIHTLNSVAFKEELDLLYASAAWVSIPVDFLLKISGIAVIDTSFLKILPWINLNSIAINHILRLSCLTSYYEKFWERNIKLATNHTWASSDLRLPKNEISRNWDRNSAYRTDYVRRMALVELDVLVAQELGLSLEDLLNIYSTYFPVMQQYENNTWYDQNGQIVWTSSRGLPGVGYLCDTGKRPSQANWMKEILENDEDLICNVEDNTQPDGPRMVERKFVRPFDKCDRIADYKRAWAHFDELRSKGLL